jgi:FkbM family methyltransferase
MKILNIRWKIATNGKRFVDQTKNDILILGTNKYGIQTAGFLEKKGFSIKGFINDQIESSEYCKYRVLQSQDVQSGSSIVNCIVEGRSIDAAENIAALKPLSTTDYFSLQLAFPGELSEIDFFSDTGSIEFNTERYEWLYKWLEDEESKMTLENLTNFRFNRDINFLRNFRFRLSEQYFEPFVSLSPSSSFVDGGGFDGSTSVLFTEKYPDYRNIWYFEPNALSLESSKKRLSGMNNVKFFNKGLWNKRETLYFDNSLGPASRVSDKGNTSIEAVTLDEAVNDRVSYIKLDIEGAEYNAIKGSENIIRKFSPKLAVCVYHNQQDFLRIPELILSYNPDYRLFLRHYTQGVFETVMYFI